MTHLFPEIAWSRECNVTLVAFVWLFTTVRFQKSWIQGCSNIGYNCLTFLNCAFSDVSSNDVHKRIHSRIGCICLTFHHYGFSNVSSNCLHARMQSHINCSCFCIRGTLCNIFVKGPHVIAQYFGFLYDTQTIFAIFTIWLKMRVNCRKCDIRAKFVKCPYNTYKIILYMHKKCTKCINSCCYMSYHKKFMK